MYTIITVTFNPDGGKLYDYLLLNPEKNLLDRKKPLTDERCMVYYIGYKDVDKIPEYVTSSITLHANNCITISKGLTMVEKTYSKIDLSTTLKYDKSKKRYEISLTRKPEYSMQKVPFYLEESQFLRDQLVFSKEGKKGFSEVHVDVCPNICTRIREYVYHSKDKKYLAHFDVGCTLLSINDKRGLERISGATFIYDSGLLSPTLDNDEVIKYYDREVLKRK